MSWPFDEFGYPTADYEPPYRAFTIPRWDNLSDLMARPLALGSLSLTKSSPYSGRRARVLSLLWFRELMVHPGGAETFGDLYRFIHSRKGKKLAGRHVDSLSLRGLHNADNMITSIPENYVNSYSVKDPEVHYALQDLGWLIGWELTQACAALDDPDVWYPGIDEGIEPVTNDHVELVIWASQRELDRELRRGPNGFDLRPAVPLASLPKRVQRAFVERRRWHYLQYGIGREEWLNNSWSVYSVVEDPLWIPPWINIAQLS